MAPAEKSLLLPYLVDGPHLSTTISQPTCSARCQLPGTINSKKNKSTSSHSYFFFFFLFFSTCVLAKKKRERERPGSLPVCIFFWRDYQHATCVCVYKQPTAPNTPTHPVRVSNGNDIRRKSVRSCVIIFDCNRHIYTHTQLEALKPIPIKHTAKLSLKKCNVCC